ncbi:MAG: hypothetical protein U0R49_02340 [Fimbriimonadales bacterium]
MIPIAIMTLMSPQHGHEIKYLVEKEGTVSYRVWGSVLRQYAGGKTAPALRSANVNGVFTLTFKRSMDGFDVSGAWDALKLSDQSKPLPESDRKRATFGKWIGAYPTGPFKLLINGKAATPSPYSALGWPLLWAPLKQGLSLRIDDETARETAFPVSAFLEDDPIEDVLIPLRVVFEGPHRDGEKRYWKFKIDTEFSNVKPVKHPDVAGLSLATSARIGGSLLLRREDGSLENGAMFATYRFELLKPNNEIPFSSCNATVACNWERLPPEPRK